MPRLDGPRSPSRPPSHEIKQTTRLIKVVCPYCECIARITRQWLSEVGAPFCGCIADKQRQAFRRMRPEYEQ